MNTVLNIHTQSDLSTLIHNALLDELKPIFNMSSIYQSPIEQYIIVEPNSFTDKMLEKEKTQRELVSTTIIPFILPVPFP